MMTDTNIRGYRIGVPSARRQARIMPRPRQQLSALFLKVLACMLVVSVITVFAGSLLLGHQVRQLSRNLQEMQVARQQLGATNIDLNVERVRLTSRQRIVEEAGRRLGLVEPDRSRVHRF